MRAIALSAVVLAMGVCARADARDEVRDVIASMTAALSDDNAAGFMNALDKGMPGYDQLHQAIPALLGQGNIVSSVQALRDEGDGARRVLQLDWYLEIRNPDENAPVIRRREVVHCTLEKRDGRWRVTSLDPITFFQPENYTHK